MATTTPRGKKPVTPLGPLVPGSPDPSGGFEPIGPDVGNVVGSAARLDTSPSGEAPARTGGAAQERPGGQPGASDLSPAQASAYASAAKQAALARTQASQAAARDQAATAAAASKKKMADWYTNVAPTIIQNKDDLTAAQAADNADLVGGTGGTAASFKADLVTDGGFTPQQAAQLEAIWNADYNDPTKSAEQIYLDLINSAPVKERYPAISEMQAKGLPPITISQYQNVEQDLAALHQAAGIPLTSYTSADVTNAIVSGIPITGGPDSVEGRIQAATTWSQNLIAANPDAWNDMQKWYGVTPGSLAAYSLTHDQGQLTNQLTSTSIAAGLQGQGFSQVDKSQMQALASQGVTAEQAANASAASIGGSTNAGADVGLTGVAGARLSGVSFSQAELASASLGGKVYANGVATGETQGEATIAGRRAVAGAAARFASGGNYGTGGTSAAGSTTE